MAKEIEEQPNTIKTGIKEYVDKANSDINIYNFPWNINEISTITLIGFFIAFLVINYNQKKKKTKWCFKIST